MRRQKKRKRPPLLNVASYEHAAAGASWSAREHECQRGQNPQACIDSEQPGSATRSMMQPTKSGPWWRHAYQQPRAGHLGEHLSSVGVGADPPSFNTHLGADVIGSSAKGSVDDNGAIADLTATTTKASPDPATGILHDTVTAACCPDGNGQPNECVNADQCGWHTDSGNKGLSRFAMTPGIMGGGGL